MIQHNHNGAWVSGLLVLTTLLNLGRALYQKRHPVLPEGKRSEPKARQKGRAK